jgi:hypothetical protein
MTKYEVIAGARRLRAAKLTELEVFPSGSCDRDSASFHDPERKMKDGFPGVSVNADCFMF